MLLLVVKPVSSSSTMVGVRIQGDSGENLNSLDREDNMVIDYGSFQWTIMPRQDLLQLDARNIPYQVVNNPYQLTLGGQSFDPLSQSPAFSPSWKAAQKPGAKSLHLVQFQGPVKAEWLDSLMFNGLDVVQYIHPFTYLVWGANESLENSQTNVAVRWTGDFLPGYAVLPESRSLGTDRVRFRMLSYPKMSLAPETIETLGGEEVRIDSNSDPTFDVVTFTLPGNQLDSIAALPGVFTIQPVPTNGGDRTEMSSQVNVGNVDETNLAFTGYFDWLDGVGLSGAGVIIANVDSGIDQSHPDLTNRILPCTGSTCGEGTYSTHGTHTAGIMAGDASSGVVDSYGFLRGLGVAPGANLIEQLYYNNDVSDFFPMEQILIESVSNNAVISGNSWGPSGTPLGYDLDTRLVDIGVRDADPNTQGDQALTYVLSIMNGNGGTSTQGSPDEAKNAFTIGSTKMQTGSGVQNLAINDISSNSAHGPALDGRLIPHLVAPGCYVDSTVVTGQDYDLLCGTSMASPQVSGSAALFFEYYRNLTGEDPSPALVKAAFLPVAVDLAGNQDADGGILGHPFDAKQGWGRLNNAAVLNPTGTVYYFDQETILDNTGEFQNFELNLTQSIESLRVMLVWTDAPGHGLGGETPAWVNDLDLSVSINGQTYYGNNFGGDGLSVTGGSPDEKNNTEGIFLSDLSATTVTLTITGANISGDGVPNEGDETDQDFALVLYLTLEPMTYRFFIPAFFQ
jgi:hypothetical protein